MNLNRAKKAGGVLKIESSRHTAATVENPWRAHVRATDVEAVDVFVDDLESALVRVLKLLNEELQNQQKPRPLLTVVGCVAWFSNTKIIEAMRAHCRRVLLLVSDQDYAKWGGGVCRERFDKLPRFDEPLWQAFAGLGGPLSVMERDRKQSKYAPVRCFGPRTVKIAETEKERLRTNPRARPSRAQHGRMLKADGTGFSRGSILHSKYLVFFDEDMRPRCVWTGSFNMTQNAGRNQENAVLIWSEQTAAAYYHDFANTFKQSHSLYASATTGKKRPRPSSKKPPAKRRKTTRS